MVSGNMTRSESYVYSAGAVGRDICFYQVLFCIDLLAD